MGKPTDGDKIILKCDVRGLKSNVYFYKFYKNGRLFGTTTNNTRIIPQASIGEDDVTYACRAIATTATVATKIHAQNSVVSDFGYSTLSCEYFPYFLTVTTVFCYVSTLLSF